MAQDLKIKRDSRLRFSDYIIIDGYTFWDLNNLSEYQVIGDELRHYVQANDRIDLLAYKYYRSSNLWWIIAWANNLDILPTQLNEGDELLIPSPTYVNTFVLGSTV